MIARTMAALLVAAAVLSPVRLSAADQADAAGKRAAPLKTGDIPPDFTLTDQDGRRHTLSAEIAWTRIDLQFQERPPISEIRAALDALK